MEDFEFQNKGRILFGEGKRDEFLQGVKALSDKVLVVCGPHFARSGELGEMLTAFEEIGIRTWAIADLHQSTIEQARVAWKLCRDNEIGLWLESAARPRWTSRNSRPMAPARKKISGR